MQRNFCGGALALLAMVHWLATTSLANAARPSFSSNRIAIAASVREEEQRGTVFANLRKSLEERLGNKQSTREFQFAVIGEQKPARYFNVTRGGMVAISEKIDREALCRQIQACCAEALTIGDEGATGMDNMAALESSHVDGNPCKLEMEVTAYVNQQPIRFTFSVTVIDKNDNAPFWPQPYHVLQVREGAKNGHVRYPLPAAIDLDEPRNAVRLYRIVQQLPFEREPTFSVTYDGGSNELLKPFLQQNAALDRESREWYNLTVEASDGENYSRLNLFVYVTDVNDHPPRLERTFYNVSVPENMDAQELIVSVRANDSDVAQNAQIVYSLAEYSSSSSSADAAVRIEAATGRVFLNGRRLDYETQKAYLFLITATDCGSPPLSATATLQLNVLDVNDEVPVMNIVNGLLQPHLSIAENQPIGSRIGYLQVSDADTPIRQVSCESRSDDFHLTVSNNGIFDIRTRRQFDREVQTSVNITVSCRDGTGSLANFATLTQKVDIIDLNDNPPSFLRSMNGTFVVDVLEGNAPNAVVLDTTAYDPDAGDNGLVTYRLLGAGANFRVANQSGIITAMTALDREKSSEYRFSVVAVDHGTPQHSITAAVHVRVLDVNDHAPLFSQPGYHFSVTENEKPGLFVGKVYASDADETQFEDGVITFFVNTSIEHDFDVRRNGEIYTARLFDREQQATYNVTVFASDRGYPAARTSSVLVTITIIDENDNAPRFVWQPNSTIHISYRAARIGAVIAQISAVDPDEGTNGHIVYSKADNGVVTSFLHIHPDSGDLVLSRAMSESDVGLYLLLIEARDSGEQSKATLVSATINVVETVRADIQESLWDFSSDPNRMKTILFLASISILFALALIVAAVFIIRCRVRASNSRCVVATRRVPHSVRTTPARQTSARSQSNENMRSANYRPILDLSAAKSALDGDSLARFNGALDSSFSPWFNSPSPSINQPPAVFNQRTFGSPSIGSRDSSIAFKCESFNRPAHDAAPFVASVRSHRPHSMCAAQCSSNECAFSNAHPSAYRDSTRQAAARPFEAGTLDAISPLNSSDSELHKRDEPEAQERAKPAEAARLMPPYAESQAFSPAL